MRISALLFSLAMLCGTAPAQGWSRLADVPAGAHNYAVSTGSAICGSDSLLFFLKGRYNEFYSYWPAANIWTLRESLPVVNRLLKKRYAGRGTSLAGCPQGVFCSKGNLSYDLWRYEPDTAAYPWTQSVDVPMGAKYAGDGSGMAVVDSFLYLVKGNLTFEFCRFNLNRRLWDVSLPSYPLGPSGKPVGAGGCVAAACGRTYSLKGGGRVEFYSFDPESLAWRIEPDIPTGPSGRGVGTGGCMAWDGRDTIYCLKGNYTSESWAYSVSAANWTQLPDLPPGPSNRDPGRGASLTAVEGAVFATKGNSTFEFYGYSPCSGTAGPRAPTRQRLSLTVAPNPARGRANLNVSPGGRSAYLRVTAADGRTVRDFGTFCAPVTVCWDGRDDSGRPIPAGVYFGVAESPAGRITQRFVELGN